MNFSFLKKYLFSFSLITTFFLSSYLFYNQFSVEQTKYKKKVIPDLHNCQNYDFTQEQGDLSLRAKVLTTSECKKLLGVKTDNYMHEKSDKLFFIQVSIKNNSKNTYFLNHDCPYTHNMLVAWEVLSEELEPKNAHTLERGFIIHLYKSCTSHFIGTLGTILFGFTSVSALQSSCVLAIPLGICFATSLSILCLSFPIGLINNDFHMGYKRKFIKDLSKNILANIKYTEIPAEQTISTIIDVKRKDYIPEFSVYLENASNKSLKKVFNLKLPALKKL